MLTPSYSNIVHYLIYIPYPVHHYLGIFYSDSCTLLITHAAVDSACHLKTLQEEQGRTWTKHKPLQPSLVKGQMMQMMQMGCRCFCGGRTRCVTHLRKIRVKGGRCRIRYTGRRTRTLSCLRQLRLLDDRWTLPTARVFRRQAQLLFDFLCGRGQESWGYLVIPARPCHLMVERKPLFGMTQRAWLDGSLLEENDLIG